MVYWLEKALLVLIVILGVRSVYTQISPEQDFNSYQLLLDISKFLIILFFLTTARPAKKIQLNVLSASGVLFSFGAPLFFSVKLQNNTLLNTLITANSVFYTVLLLWAYLCLGRNLGVFPGVRSIVTTGLYKEVRHPIYAMYLYIFTTAVVYDFSVYNFMLLMIFIIGIYWRIISEESLLSKELVYQKYMSQSPSRILSWVLALPVGLIIVAKVYVSFHDEPRVKELKVVSAYPIMTLNPIDYDEWHSVFIGNHIYRWLVPTAQRPYVESITDKVLLSCSDIKNSTCTRQKVEFNVFPFKDCSNKLYTKEMIKSEWELLNNHHNWVFQNPSKCKNSDYDICLNFDYQKDTQRRLRNLYFRFGWMFRDEKQNKYGAGQYCFVEESRSESAFITAGKLVPRVNPSLPVMKFVTNDTVNVDYDLNLYGQPSDQTNQFLNLDSNTPLGYIVVTNPKLGDLCAPWNQTESKIIINSFLKQSGLTYEAQPQVKDLLGSGGADKKRCLDNLKAEGGFFTIPNYLPQCEHLEKSLNQLWSKKYNSLWKATCLDTTKFILENVLSKSASWSGFLTPVSPGYPGRDAIVTQYFKPNSSMSWVGSVKDPVNYFYFAGIGKSLVTVKKGTICGLSPSTMGLGELLYEDLKLCGKD